MRKIKNVIAIVAVLVLASTLGVGGLWGLSVLESPDTSKIFATTQKQDAIKASMPDNLIGSWRTREDAAPKMSAEITADTIFLKAFSETASMNYWYGSFKVTPGSSEIISTALESNKFVMATGPTKKFTFQDGSIFFEISMMGVTTVVEMIRG